MLLNFKNDIVIKLLQQRNLQMSIILGAFIIILLLIIANISLSQGLGVKLVPSQITEPLLLTKKGGDAAYLRNIADYFVRLYLDVTPNNGPLHIEQILHYVNPKEHAVIRDQLTREIGGLAKHNQSRFFSPIKYQVDATNNTVFVVGDELYMIGKKISNSIRKKYELQFRFDRGNPYLTKFKVVEDD